MTNPNASARVLSAFSVLGALLLSGCTHNYDIPETVYSQGGGVELLPLSVDLRIDDAFSNTQWRQEMLGDVFILELGPALARNAENTAREAFSSVTVSNAETGSIADGMDAVLRPRVVLLERSIGATAFGEQVTTLALEWSLMDAGGELIWIETVRGEGRATSGNIFTHRANTREAMDLLLADLFSRSYQAIVSSSEVRQFAAQVSRTKP